jgi:hypothetical protein
MRSLLYDGGSSEVRFPAGYIFVKAAVRRRIKCGGACNNNMVLIAGRVWLCAGQLGRAKGKSRGSKARFEASPAIAGAGGDALARMGTNDGPGRGDSRDVAQLLLQSASRVLSKLQGGWPKKERVASFVPGDVTGLALRTVVGGKVERERRGEVASVQWCGARGVRRAIC